MTWILDTDHFSELDRATRAGQRLRQRMNESEDGFFISVVTAEETMQGWLAKLRSCKVAGEQIAVYARFEKGLKFLNNWMMLPWDEETVARFQLLREAKIRIGTMDLKIASAALAYDMTMLMRNSIDFSKVPGLRVENWLD